MLSELPVSLAHGNGGVLTQELVHNLLARCLSHGRLDIEVDAAPFAWPEAGEGVFTSDSCVVDPLEFPGGDIGQLALFSTVNNLAVMGADPLFMGVNVLVEEGLATDTLERIMTSMGKAARGCNMRVLAGDLRVVPQGRGGGLYLTTSGLGVRPMGVAPAIHHIRQGDLVLVSGPLANHGTAVLTCREEGWHDPIQSDCTAVLPLTQPVRQLSGLRFMRDPGRGGLAMVAWEICQATGLGVRLQQKAIPMERRVRAICEIMGHDPLYLASAGQVVAVASPTAAREILALWQALPQGKQAAVVGEIVAKPERVTLVTFQDEERGLPVLKEESMSRIC